MATTEPQLQVGQEYILPGEDKIVAQMVAEMEAQLDKMYKDKKMLRQIHTKMHGCVKAEFIIEPSLPAELRVGVFSEPKKYHAWVRFSNANTKQQHDKKKDVRGIAIKLMGVPGEKILPDQRLQQTQDFLLMSSETYFSKSIVKFSPTLRAFTSGDPLKLILYILNPFHWPRLGKIQKSMIPCDNPFTIPYWTTQPYRFGGPDVAVKYFLQPSPDNNIVNANFTDYDYLRVNMAQTLNNNEISFDFFIQFQTNAETMPIEDPTVAWTSPYIKMATLKIIPQSFDANAQREFAENLSFNIWHALPVHRPLGNFNRARGKIYEALSKFRHDKNNQPVFEPTDAADFLSTEYKNTKDTASQKIPAGSVINVGAEVIVDCNKETAFKYISDNIHLADWLKKSGMVAGEKRIEIIEGPYTKVGAKRKVFFEDGNSLVEELISYNTFANYAYQVTQFSNFFKKFTDKAYGQLWFDTVNDKTRIRWVYHFTYKNFFSKIIMSLILMTSFKKFMQHALNIAKGEIEKGG